MRHLALPRPMAWLVLGGASALALVAAALVDRNNERVAEARFEKITQETVSVVQDRMARYQYGLRGVRGHVMGAGVDRMTRAGFARYSASRDMVLEFPGTRGMGVIRRVAAADTAAFVAAARRDGAPGFSLRQLAPHDRDRYIIQYIEPQRRNLQAIGLDIASEANRRDAAQLSMHTGEATLTGPITLVQATGQPQRSFLLMLPIYRPDALLDSAEEREEATLGWAYAPLVIDEVLAGIGLQGDSVSLTLRDLSDPDNPVFLASPGSDEPAAAGLSRTLRLTLYGRVWEAQVRARPLFLANLGHSDPRAVAMAGLALALLLATLAQSFAQARQRMVEVRAEQTRRAAMMQGASDAIVGQDLDGLITDWNPAAERLFGRSAEQALGRPVAALLLPPERIAEDEQIRAAALRGERLPPFDTTRCRSDGSLVEVSITVSPILAANGRCIGVFKAMRDISQARRAERDVREVNARLESQVTERTAMLESARQQMQTILDAVPSMIGWWDRDLNNLVTNRAYADWLGADPAALKGRALRELLDEEAFEQIQPHVQAVLRGEAQTFERSRASADGSGRRHSLTHYQPEVVDGEVRGFFVMVNDISEIGESRQRLAAALRDNEALLGTIQTHAIVSVTDRSGRILEVNDNFCAISGYAREELLGQTHRLVNSGVQARGFWIEMWRTIASGKPWRGDVCNRAKDGSLYWVDSIIAPFVGADGKVEKYISIRTDISARKQLETDVTRARERAEHSERFLYDIADKVPMRIAYVDHQQRFQFVNHAYCERFRRQREDIIGHTREAVDGAPPAEDILAHTTAVLAGETRHFEFEDLVDGVSRTFDAQMLPDLRDDGSVRGFYSVSADVTERKAVELRSLQTSALLHNVLESATEVAIIAVAPDGVVRIFNQGAERLLGYARTEVVGRESSLKFHDEQELRACAQELSQRLGRPVHWRMALIDSAVLGRAQEWSFLRKDGQRLIVSLIVTAMHSADGELFGYLGVAHDVSRQHEIEASLRAAAQEAERASLAKSQFLANMSHEIRTPMNAVIGLTYLLSQTALDAEQAAFVAKVRLASKSLLAVINDVLDLSKIEAGELSLEQATFSPRELLDNLHSLMSLQAQAKGVDLLFELPQDLPAALVGDATRLGQVLSNLVSNAIKFTARGSVRVRLRRLAAGPDSVRLHLAVQDSGIGISPEAQARLFTPFAQADSSTTRRFGGTGLGLSIVKRLIDMMGGRVGLSSTEGVGSEFWVEADFALGSVSALALPAAAIAADGLAGVRVLVVDDSDINLDVAKRILERAGASVTLAGDGAQAVARLRASPTTIDLVLMDAQMPVLDGYAATRQIRGELGLSDLPVIALTAGALTSEMALAKEAGMNDFISKPFEPLHLLAAVRRHVGEVPPAAAGALAGAASTVAEMLHGAAGATEPWPSIAGIDTRTVQSRLAGDVELFRSLLRRFLGEFQSLPALADPAGGDALKAHGDLMHKVRGSAGTLGAKALHTLASEAEAACRRGDHGNAARLTTELEAGLAGLARAVPGGFLDRAPVPVLAAQAAGALDAAAMDELVDLLREQDLDALGCFQALAETLCHHLGPPDFARLRDDIENLRFEQAAQALSALSSASPRSTG